ncbi:MAG: hypothetical protein mread185_000332 [Mycoplasmataceae bacterium]|nr:MAG: hypothetical protein mread185_000236 [Mycoplasmataceae bacterium]WNE40875.1 MAG: hypothetical protein mread185_000332 [Mycoplasmataceae bacterium]
MNNQQHCETCQCSSNQNLDLQEVACHGCGRILIRFFMNKYKNGEIICNDCKTNR